MRIGFDASPVRSRQSGVGHYAQSLLEALAGAYPSCEFAILSHRSDLPFQGKNLRRTQSYGFPIKEIWMQLWLPAILRRCRPELCHFTNGVAPLRMELPYVVTVHDLSLLVHPEWHPRTRRLWMKRILLPSVTRANWILCDSEATRRDLLGWIQLKDDKISVVALGVRSAFFRQCPDSEKNNLRIQYDLDRPFFLYLGNIEPRKNLKLLVDAFRALASADVDLVLAGRRAWLWRDLLRSVRSGASPGRVRMLEYVREVDLPALYQSAMAFVYPSLMEGFGLPVLEAMASSVPVITSRIEPLQSLLGDAGWLAAPDDPREWTGILKEALDSKDRRDACARRGRELAAEYTWEKTARETMRCYERALGSL